MAVVYIGLGTNVGNREQHIRRALELLSEQREIEVKKISSLYETTPVGGVEQRDFINAAVEVETSLSPKALLSATKAIEKKQERKPGIHWGPRTIDLDILLYDKLEIDEPELRVPHPEIKNRAFVLVPLAEIAADKSFPEGDTVRELLEKLGKIEGVRPLEG